jgi:hypothetical protein
MSAIAIPIDDLRRKILAKSTPAENGCRIWTKAKQTKGYGSVGVGNGKTMLAHRAAYVAFVGPIPDGLTVDHVCHNRDRRHCPGGPMCVHRLCVEGGHLEAVTNAENTWRGQADAALREFDTHCLFGHEMTEANTYRRIDRSKGCRTCKDATLLRICAVIGRAAP